MDVSGITQYLNLINQYSSGSASSGNALSSISSISSLSSLSGIDSDLLTSLTGDLNTTGTNEDFATLLSQKIEELSDMEELTSALGNTVLGSTGYSLSELSEMMTGTKGQELLHSLLDGQFSAQVLTDTSDTTDSEDEDSNSTYDFLSQLAE